MGREAAERDWWGNAVYTGEVISGNTCNRFSKSVHPVNKEAVMPDKPSEKEQEYFARMEYERRKKTEDEKQRQLAEEQKKKLKELHYMRCPKCGMQLIEIDYRGMKVDKCSNCEGIWLDAGELEAVSKLEKTGLDKLFEVFKR